MTDNAKRPRRRRRRRGKAQGQNAPLQIVSAEIDPHPDDRLFRPLSGRRGDIPRPTHSRMQKIAHELWTMNLMGKRLIEVVTDHVIGEGVSWKSKDEDALEAVEAFWGDPVNRFDLQIEQLISELGIFGELLLPVAVSKFEGKVRVGYISPRLIDEVVSDPDNCALPIGVVLKKGGGGPGRKIQTVLSGDPREYLGPAAQRERDKFRDGLAFLFQINKTIDATRGLSDILAAIDWIDIHERFLFDSAERARMQNSYIYDVVLKGAGPEQIAEWISRNGAAPRPGSARVHNEKETWSAVAPQGGGRTQGTGELANLMKSHYVSGMGVPKSWMGQLEDVNRATGEAEAQPGIKHMTRRQRSVRHMLHGMTEFQLQEAHRAGRISKESLDAGAMPVLPEMSTKDLPKLAAALRDVTQSASMALNLEIASKKTATELFAHMASTFGLDIDPAEEIERVEEERLQSSLEIYRRREGNLVQMSKRLREAGNG